MARPNSRATLTDYCLRKLGAPVIEINVDPEQIEDRIDDALDIWEEFHSDATVRTFFKYQLTQTDVTNGYIPVSSNIISIKRLFPFVESFGTGRNMFDIKYQMMLNDMADMYTYIGDLAYYEQMQQYLSLLDMKLNGLPQYDFSRIQDRLYIHGDFEDGDLVSGRWIVAEAFQVVDPDTHTSIYDNEFIKEYTTQLIKQQWGSNLKKYENMQLPGGVIINGQILYDEATAELEAMREKLRLEHELPIDFLVG